MTSRSAQAASFTGEGEPLERAFLRLVPGDAGGERERRHHLVMIEGLLRREAGLSEAEVEQTLDRANGWDAEAGSPEGRVLPFRRIVRGGRYRRGRRS